MTLIPMWTWSRIPLVKSLEGWWNNLGGEHYRLSIQTTLSVYPFLTETQKVKVKKWYMPILFTPFHTYSWVICQLFVTLSWTRQYNVCFYVDLIKYLLQKDIFLKSNKCLCSFLFICFEFIILIVTSGFCLAMLMMV